MSPQLFKNGFRGRAFNANHQFAFVGKVERVQPQQFAKPTNGGLNGQAALGEFNPASAACRKLMDHGVDTASRGIPQGLHAGNTAQRLNQRGEYRAVAAQFAVQPGPSRRFRMVAPWQPSVPVTISPSPTLRRCAPQ